MPKSVDSGKLSVSKAVVWWMPVQAAMVIAEEVMAGHYRHTQRSPILMRGSLLIVTLFGGLFMIGEGAALRSGDYLDWFSFCSKLLLLAVIVGPGWLCKSLTVEVSGTEIRWYFGPGLWDYRIALSDIEGVGIVRNTWLNGFGIRMRPGWRLYNVSGLDAVELRLKTGDIRCIGTDDPQGLAAALKSSGPA